MDVQDATLFLAKAWIGGPQGITRDYCPSLWGRLITHVLQFRVAAIYFYCILSYIVIYWHWAGSRPRRAAGETHSDIDEAVRRTVYSLWPSPSGNSKREIPSAVSSVFNPLGLLARLSWWPASSSKPLEDESLSESLKMGRAFPDGRDD